MVTRRPSAARTRCHVSPSRRFMTGPSSLISVSAVTPCWKKRPNTLFQVHHNFHSLKAVKRLLRSGPAGCRRRPNRRTRFFLKRTQRGRHLRAPLFPARTERVSLYGLLKLPLSVWLHVYSDFTRCSRVKRLPYQDYMELYFAGHFFGL